MTFDTCNNHEGPHVYLTNNPHLFVKHLASSNYVKAISFFTFFLFLQIKVTGADGSPIANQAVYLYVVDSLEFTLYTDQKGIAVFSLDTSSWSESVSLSVSGDLLQLLVAFCTKRVSCWANNPIGRCERSILKYNSGVGSYCLNRQPP